MIRRIRQLRLENFRGFGGEHVIPLDASVVLIFGSNGAGKSALLQAVECALTGDVADFKRYERDYPHCFAHLPHRGPVRAEVQYEATDGTTAKLGVTLVDGRWVVEGRPIEAPVAAFLRDQAYLPQSRLTRFLQQNEPTREALEQSTSELLGLGFLSHVVEGLNGVAGDIRRVKRDSPRVADLYAEAEALQRRLPRETERVSEIEGMILDEMASIQEADPLGLGLRVPDAHASAEIREFAAHAEALFVVEELSARLRELRRLEANVLQARNLLLSIEADEESGSPPDVRVEDLQAEAEALRAELVNGLNRAWVVIRRVPAHATVHVPEEPSASLAAALAIVRQVLSFWADEAAALSDVDQEINAVHALIEEARNELGKLEGGRVAIGQSRRT
jgi:energy-coupling factor transporter ATP-binding protein EcfA2